MPAWASRKLSSVFWSWAFDVSEPGWMVAPHTTQFGERSAQCRQNVWPQGVVCGRKRMDLQMVQCMEERREELDALEVKPSGHTAAVLRGS